MKKKRSAEEQIIGSIEEHESGVKTKSICRRLLGISSGSLPPADFRLLMKTAGTSNPASEASDADSSASEAAPEICHNKIPAQLCRQPN